MPTHKHPFNILIFGAADILMRPVVEQIKNLLPTSSNCYVVGNKYDIGLTNLVRMERRSGQIEKLLKSYKYSDDALDLASIQSYDSLMTGLEHLERKSKSFVWRHHNLDSISDSKDYYYIVVDLLTKYLIEKNINLILFFEIPHLFSDTVCYQIAKEKSIATLILTPSIFPDRFFSLQSIEDNGKFPDLLHEENFDSYSIDPKEEKVWQYMKGVEQYRGELGTLNWQGILMLFVNIISTQPSKILKINLLLEYIKRMRKIASTLPKWRYPFSNYFDTRHLDYFETIVEHENKEFDLDLNFVYFPLHLQPEMTTAAIGGQYSDQLLAIEKLSRILPSNYFIFVKENPKQGGQMRGQQFFGRLNRIRNVQWLPSWANTHELIDKCQFVATITGTVGWEAICKGKIVLVFGMPWYRNLTGVISFREGLTLEDISKCTIKHEQLERQVGQLISRSHVGNIEPLKRRHSSGGYDLESNANLVVNSIAQLIEQKIENTFVS